MHPMVKILLLLTTCQVLQFGYLMWHAHALHGSTKMRYLAKIAPLGICVALVAYLMLALVMNWRLP